MSKQLNLLEGLINNLSTRERLLVLLGALSIVYILWDSFLVAPIQAINNDLSSEHLLIQEQITILETRRILANSLLKNSKRKQILDEIQIVKTEMKTFDSQIIERLQGRVAPQYMASLLNDMLQKNEKLQLISINNLPAVPFVSSSSDHKDEDIQTINDPISLAQKKLNTLDSESIGIFMHPLEIQLQGRYLDILNYLTALEKMDWKVFWDQVKLEVMEYPNVKVQIKVHTFSLKDGWLSV